MPDEKIIPENIYLNAWQHDLGTIHDGSSTRYLQIQVRRKTSAESKQLCDELIKLLDSGINEEVIALTAETWCISRPRQGASIISRTNTTVTYYIEIALWGLT